MPPIAKYSIATLVPLTLLLAAGGLWGGFGVAALIWLTLVVALLDRVLEPPSPSKAHGWAGGLTLVLAFGHLMLVPVVLIALTGPELGTGQKIALFAATASFIGQVSHPNAHELIHAKGRLRRALGALVYVSMGFGHHVSAHRLVHHRHVATPQDPNTPRLGESFWRYLPRAWIGSFRAGYKAEARRLDTGGRGAGPHPYGLWVGGAGLSAVLATSIAGAPGFALLLGLWFLTGVQILMSDYLQHYGLYRLTRASGRPEPVGPHHSWDAPAGFSSYLMLNAPSHAAHHLHPDRPFGALEADGPATLPYPMPIMAMLALVPSAWHRRMDARARYVMAAAKARMESDTRAAA